MLRYIKVWSNIEKSFDLDRKSWIFAKKTSSSQSSCFEYFWDVSKLTDWFGSQYLMNEAVKVECASCTKVVALGESIRQTIGYYITWRTWINWFIYFTWRQTWSVTTKRLLSKVKLFQMTSTSDVLRFLARHFIAILLLNECLVTHNETLRTLTRNKVRWIVSSHDGFGQVKRY